ncbi:MAG: SAM-dependent methyltransferase [Proteobacteria bacterium]|nr:MAG: SAM-dependent methyltransferase [Pseudomonadota bacterium]
MAKNTDTTRAWYEANAKKFYADTVHINMAVLYVPFLNYMRPYASILDAGCGSGRDTLYFSKRGYAVTAFDSSQALVKLAAKLTGKEIMTLAFQDLDIEDRFDGVWACASLIHVPMADMQDVLARISRSMKVGGVLYASFTHGTGEHIRDGRSVIDLDEKGFDDLIKPHAELAVIRSWKTEDLLPDRQKEKWLNVLVRKSK